MKRYSVFPIVLTVLVFTFYPALSGDFLYWDDTMNIRDNGILRQGEWLYFWKNQYFNIYIPVTYTLWTFLWKLWPSASAYHLLNLFIHAVNVSLIYLLVRRLFAERTKLLAWLAALIFALHPLQNEAVAWISGGRDLLGAMFALLAFNALIWPFEPSLNAKKIAVGRTIISTLLFIMSLLAKPTLVTWPAALLVMVAVRRHLHKPQKATLVLWLLLSAGCALLARTIQSGITIRLVRDIPWYKDILVGLDSLGFYLKQIFWPLNLASDYGRSPDVLFEQSLYWQTLPVILIAGLFIYWGLKKRPSWSWDGWFFMVIALAPLLGVVPFMAQSQSTVADRYLYWAWIGPSIFLAQVATTSTWAIRAAVFLLIACSALTFERSGIYNNNQDFFSEMLRYNPQSYVGNNSMGVIQFEAGNLPLAEKYIQRAHEILPLHPTAVSNLTQLFYISGQYDRIQKELEPLLKNNDFIDNQVANPNSLTKMYKYVAFGQAATGRWIEANMTFCTYMKMSPYDDHAGGEFERVIREMKARNLNVIPCL